MARNDVPMFGMRRDGGLHRRRFLQSAAQFGAGLFGASGFGLLSRTVLADSTAVKIGWIRPTTGHLASSFAPLYVSGLIAVDEINAAGGIMGHPIVRDEVDDEASPAKEPGIVRKLQEDEVGYVCGPTGSSQSLSALAVTSAAKVINTTYAFATEVADGKKYPYHYQLIFNTDLEAEVNVRHMIETLKIKKIGVLQENTAYGEQIMVATRTIMKRFGLEPVGVEVYPIAAPDLSGYVANLQKAGADGVVAWLSNTPNSAMIFNAMNSMKWYPPIVGHVSLFDEALFNLVPPEALKNIYSATYKSLTWSDEAAPQLRHVEFAKKMSTYPEVKSLAAIAAGSPYYDFLHLLKVVIEGEKTFDADKIKRALDNVKGYKSLLATINFTPDNHSGVGVEDMAMGSVASGRDPGAMGIFRKRASA